MDLEQARFNMVEQQIRPWEVLDQDVLDLLFAVRREDFVPPDARACAYADGALPIEVGPSPCRPPWAKRGLSVTGHEVCRRRSKTEQFRR